ncbi:hypothetical protein UlMin_010078 [Ulmus minor]
MKGTLGLLSSGSSTNDPAASKVEVLEKDYVGSMSSEASSYGTEAELELGLGLSLGGRSGLEAGKGKPSKWGECGRILTAKDFPSVVSRGPSAPSRFSERGVVSSVTAAVSGTKRAAEEGGSPTGVSQVVGWPPIRASRIHSLVNHAKSSRAEEDKVVDKDKSKDAQKKKANNVSHTNVPPAKEQGHLGFVKVNIDGIAIGRKVDLNAHSCYETLAQALEDMFFSPTITANPKGAEKDQASKTYKLLDGSSEFVLTYEDKDGDWMLVGDVPWGMFLSSVKRLRIMRTSEANGLGPRFQDSNERQRSKPI